VDPEEGKMPPYLYPRVTLCMTRTNKPTQAFIQGKLINLDNHQSKLNATYKRNTISNHGIFNAILEMLRSDD
jgi:hypothetical protein